MQEIDRKIDVNEVLQRNADRFGVTVDQILDSHRYQIPYLARKKTQRELRDLGLPFAKIGEITNRHHSTVIHSVQKDVEETGIPLLIFQNEPLPKKVTSERVILTHEELDRSASTFLSQSFPEISLGDISSVNVKSEISIAGQALSRHLYYDLGAYQLQIARFLGKHHTTILHAINIPEDKFQGKIDKWNQKRARETELEVKPRQLTKAEREIQEKEERAKKDEIFAQITLEVVAKDYGVTVEQIIAPSRKKRVMQPRKTAQYIIYEGTEWKWGKVSEVVGRTDHSTAINAYNTVVNRLGFDEEFKGRVVALTEEINLLTERILKMPQATA